MRGSAGASLLALGDPNAEVAIAYRIKERLREPLSLDPWIGLVSVRRV